MLENQEFLKGISLFLILFSVIIIILFIVFVHTMPGKIARKREHPQAEAVEILSLLGLLAFPLWMAALVWAYIKPFRVPVAIEQIDAAGPDAPPPARSNAAGEPTGAAVSPDTTATTDAEQKA